MWNIMEDKNVLKVKILEKELKRIYRYIGHGVKLFKLFKVCFKHARNKKWRSVEMIHPVLLRRLDYERHYTFDNVWM